MPSQRRLQGQASLLNERERMVRIPWLLRNARAQESEQSPAEKGSDGCRRNVANSCERDSCQYECCRQQEGSREENNRRGVSRNRGMQAEGDAASECHGNRCGR